MGDWIFPYFNMYAVCLLRAFMFLEERYGDSHVQAATKEQKFLKVPKEEIDSAEEKLQKVEMKKNRKTGMYYKCPFCEFCDMYKQHMKENYTRKEHEILRARRVD